MVDRRRLVAFWLARTLDVAPGEDEPAAGAEEGVGVGGVGSAPYMLALLAGAALLLDRPDDARDPQHGDDAGEYFE